MDNKRLYAKRLVDLAIASGLTQSDIASHLGIHRAHVNRWIHGVRPVPEHYRRLLIGLISQDWPHFMQRLDSQVRPALTKEARPEQRRKARKVLAESKAFCNGVLELIEELQLESESENAARALEALKALPPGALYVSANASDIAEWATSILTYVNAFVAWSALKDTIKEVDGDADLFRELAESGHDGPASAVH